MQALVLVACLAGAYLIGSISFAVLVSRIFGLAAPRSYGSGNPGATNVLRSGSRAAAALTLLGDAAKGAMAVWLARSLGSSVGVGETAAALAALGAFVGHLYPLYFGFAGGKGVATFLGALLALDPVVGATACAVWLAVALLLRYSSLSSLCAALAAPLALAWQTGSAWPAAVVGLMSALLFARHRQNIANLLAGTERRIGEKAVRG